MGQRVQFSVIKKLDELTALLPEIGQLAEVRRVTPIVIGELRHIRPGFHPPQVIARITAQESAEFIRLSAV